MSDQASAEGNTNTDPLPNKNPAAVALGRLGGKKGGLARAERLTPERRTEIARLGALARWKKKLSVSKVTET